MRDSHYDGFAEAYAKQNETGLFNAYYEKPAMLALAGDVSGRRILDAGCGAGPTMAALRKASASVVGFDVSAAMVDLARQRHPLVEAGIFGADMKVSLVNDGPVTIPLRFA